MPVFVFFGLFFFNLRFREWTLGLNPRPFVLFHLVRFVGVVFLYLYSQGKMAYDFAIPAGVGDIIAAAGVLIVIFFLPTNTPTRRYIFYAWNIFGLIDILNAVFTAARLTLIDPNTVIVLTGFPLSLIPTFIVPMLIITHFIFFAQLWRSRKGSSNLT